MSKKAVFELSGEMVIWMFRIFALIIVLVYIAGFVSIYTNIKIDTSRLEHKIAIDKLLMQEGCLNYNRERWQPYSIDVSRFNKEVIENCLLSENLGMKLTLNYNEKILQSSYNERMTEYLSNFCNNKDFRCSKNSVNVRVLDNEIEYDGKLTYDIITKDG